MPEPLIYRPGETPFVELQSVDSTNNYALAQVHAGMARHGTAVFAHEQTGGKGQRGKNWSSERSNSLSLSIIIDPHPLSVASQFGLSEAVALATHDLVGEIVGEDTKIKWPNDIYWHDRKAGGILIESVIGSGWKWAVAGIGLNINQASFGEGIRNPVSLRQITGKLQEPISLARRLHALLPARLQMLLQNPERLHADYLDRIYKRNQVARFRKGSVVFDGTITNVSRDGRLRISHAIDEDFMSGEIELVLDDSRK